MAVSTACIVLVDADHVVLNSAINGIKQVIAADVAAATPQVKKALQDSQKALAGKESKQDEDDLLIEKINEILGQLDEQL